MAMNFSHQIPTYMSVVRYFPKDLEIEVVSS